MSGKENASLYIHIPFCTKKCPYCHFYVLLDNERLKDLLLQALLQEIDLYSDFFQSTSLVSIYFGGGTPSLFGAERLSQVLRKLNYDSSCEITLEVNPEEATSDFMKQFYDIGINRISFGVQSLDDRELLILGRSHSSFRAIQAIETTYTTGFHDISLDLMYETPGQTLASFETTLRRVCTLPINHLSLYNLTFEEGTPFYKNERALRSSIAGDEEKTAMYARAIEILAEGALTQYEISAFCRNGRVSKHNSGYWTARPFLGLGPSAFSYLNATRFRNIANLPRYAKMVASKQKPVDFIDDISAERKITELLTIHLRLIECVDLMSFERRFGALSHSTHQAIALLVQQGLLLQDERRLHITKKGLFFYDTIATALI